MTPTMNIGAIFLPTLCRLAPMAGISNAPFRLVCKELGSSLTTSEEISARGLIHKQGHTLEIASYLTQEKPIAMQIFGSEPDILAEAAKTLTGQGADLIDLNMGCPVPKVTKTGAGAALMRDAKLCATIFHKIRTAINIPFTIKIRGGWDDEHINASEIAKIAESEGVDSIAVHPRTRSQQFTGLAPWEVIRMVVESVKIPVTGNGDVKNYRDAEHMVRETGCKSVMIGRAALGAPWIFDKNFVELNLVEQHEYKYRVIKRHFTLIKENMNPALATMQMKKHLAWYITGLPGVRVARQEIFHLENENAIFDYFEDYWGRSNPPAIFAAAPANAASSVVTSPIS